PLGGSPDPTATGVGPGRPGASTPVLPPGQAAAGALRSGTSVERPGGRGRRPVLATGRRERVEAARTLASLLRDARRGRTAAPGPSPDGRGPDPHRGRGKSRGCSGPAPDR